MRYWLPPSVVDTHCTAVGAAVLARNATVLPSLVNALVLMLDPSSEQSPQQSGLAHLHKPQ